MDCAQHQPTVKPSPLRRVQIRQQVPFLKAPELVNNELLQFRLLLIVPRCAFWITQQCCEVTTLDQRLMLDERGEEVKVHCLLPEVEPWLVPGVRNILKVGFDDGARWQLWVVQFLQPFVGYELWVCPVERLDIARQRQNPQRRSISLRP